MGGIRVVPPVQAEVIALDQTCQELGKTSGIDRFEIAVQSMLQRGLKDDSQVRLADELMHQVVLGGDALEAGTKPAISAAHALHKSLIATVAPYKARWAAMRAQIETAILAYNRAKRALVEQQNLELARASDEDRRRREEEARKALRNGDMSGAQAAMQAAQAVVTPMIMNATPALDHSNTRNPWNIEITDLEAFVKCVAAGIIPLSAIKEIDTTLLKTEAKRRGGLPETWAGVRAWQGEKLSVSRR